MEVLIADAPGGVGEVYQCPSSSRMHPAFRTTSDGEPIIDSTAPAPAECLRCGGPMDVEKALPWQNKMAETQGRVPDRTRRTVKV